MTSSSCDLSTGQGQSDLEEEEYINENLRPVTVVVSDGNSFKTVIGDSSMTPGGRYYYEVKLTEGVMTKIGICRNQIDTSKVSYP